MKLLPGLMSALLLTAAMSAAAQPSPLRARPILELTGYMGTWYQAAWFPNRFQKQCILDTVASYRLVPDGVEVINRCRNAEGRIESVTGLARPAGAEIRGETLQPAQLEVSFLPHWLRWLPIWGAYWVIQYADDGRYAVVSEPSREYLWVLSRTPALASADESAIRSRLAQQGFDLARWQTHTHTPTAEVPR